MPSFELPAAGFMPLSSSSTSGEFVPNLVCATAKLFGVAVLSCVERATAGLHPTRDVIENVSMGILVSVATSC